MFESVISKTRKIKELDSLKKIYCWLQKPWMVFLILSVVFGFSYAVMVPSFMEPDESAHFNRIYQISQGQFFGEKILNGKGGYIPKAIVDFESKNAKLITDAQQARTNPSNIFRTLTAHSTTINNRNNLIAVHFENTELYSPVVYAPQVFGMVLARLTNLSIVKTYYLIRIFGLISWMAICAYGISKMDKFGWAALILLLTPLSLEIASSVTADSTTTALSVLCVGVLISALRSKEPLGKKTQLLIAGIIALFGLVKPPYMLLGTLFLLIPKEKFSNKKYSKPRFFIISFSMMIILFAGWTTIALQNYVPVRQAVAGVVINQHAHEQYLITHPLGFVHKIYETYFKVTPYEPSWILGYAKELGDTSYSLPGWAVAVYLLLLGATFASLRSSRREEYLEALKRRYSLLLVVGLFLFINVIIFVSWSRINRPVIQGIQSRYFIPILPPLILALLPIYNNKQNLSKKFYIIVPVALVFIQLAAVLAVFYRYYLPPMSIIK